jgi:hypothetical protein
MNRESSILLAGVGKTSASGVNSDTQNKTNCRSDWTENRRGYYQAGFSSI